MNLCESEKETLCVYRGGGAFWFWRILQSMHEKRKRECVCVCVCVRACVCVCMAKRGWCLKSARQTQTLSHILRAREGKAETKERLGELGEIDRTLVREPWIQPNLCLWRVCGRDGA